MDEIIYTLGVILNARTQSKQLDTSTTKLFPSINTTGKPPKPSQTILKRYLFLSRMALLSFMTVGKVRKLQKWVDQKMTKRQMSSNVKNRYAQGVYSKMILINRSYNNNNAAYKFIRIIRLGPLLYNLVLLPFLRSCVRKSRRREGAENICLFLVDIK